jgi:hypothetical protein
MMLEAARGGDRLSAGVRRDMENRLNVPLEDVRVHTDRRAAAAAESAGARALTLGRHILFGENQYRPDTHAGRRLLTHELAHVAQAREGAPADVVYGDWFWRATDPLRDNPGMIMCVRPWPFPAAYRAPTTQQRWAAKVEYFAPLNVMPSRGVAKEFWAVITLASSASANIPLIVTGAHAAAWTSTRFAFPSTRPSMPTPAQAFAWFEVEFDRDLRGGLVTAGVPAALSSLVVYEDPPPGCPCP